MTRFLLKRIGLALITLVLLSMIVFAVVDASCRATSGAPCSGRSRRRSRSTRSTSNSARTGRSSRSTWTGSAGLLHGDLGTSLTKQVPAWDLLWPALPTRFKLAFVAFIICVPLSILGGVIAGAPLRAGDRQGDHDVGLSFSAMPEFVTGIVLILVFAVWLGLAARDRAG